MLLKCVHMIEILSCFYKSRVLQDLKQIKGGRIDEKENCFTISSGYGFNA